MWGVAAWQLAGSHKLQMGERAERLYLREGFDGLETSPAGAYRWTHATAVITVPHGGPGPLTAYLRVFDAAPAPRQVRVTIDGMEVYSGATRVGGTAWVLEARGDATAESPVITIETEAWNPPGDSRTLGVALTSMEIVVQGAALRAIMSAVALFLSVLGLALAAIRRTGRSSVALGAATAAMALLGGMIAYGDVWLNGAMGLILVLSLGAAGIIGLRPPGAPMPRSAPVWGAVGLAACLLLVTLGRFNTGDAEAMYQVMLGLLKDGVPWQHNNRLWAHFGLGQSLVNIPFYWLGVGWASLTGGNEVQLAHFMVSLLNQLITPATALVLFLGARRRYGSGVALAVAGTFLLATPAIPYARLAFAEPLSGLLVLVAVLLLWVGPHARPKGAVPPSRFAILVAGICLGLAVLVKPANGIYVPFTMLYLAWSLTRDGGGDMQLRSLLAAQTLRKVAPGIGLAVAGMLPGVLLTGFFNAMRYGSPFVTGYENEGFTTPLHVGLYGLLFSPGKGIIYFAPPVILLPLALVYMWRSGKSQLRAEVLWLVCQAALVFGFHALWSSWEGNVAWGPRFLIPFVPFMLWPLGALAQVVWARRAWWALGAAGFVVAIAGTLVDQFYYFDINGVYREGTAEEWHMLFTPEWSQIVAHWRFILAGVREPMIRPTLSQMGLPPAWDLIVPTAFAALALFSLVMALRAPSRTASNT
ncbi:MAG TPA: hypothetical protein VEW94_13585 [Chloroflexia bacterium]|nr:hypothetical protein [Chloroflexia bacterium]